MSDVKQARSHQSLEDLASKATNEIALEQAKLERVTHNLVNILEAAEAIDQKRIELSLRQRRMVEEAELHRRLVSSSRFDEENVDSQVERSEGLAVESALIAKWLNESREALAS